MLKLPLNKKSFDDVELESILRFVVYTALVTPPNYKWQEFLERKWPSRKPINESSSDLKASQKEDKDTVKDRLSLTNTAVKFLLDQSLSAPINTVAFIYLMGGMTFQSNSQIWNNVQKVGHSTFNKLAILVWEGQGEANDRCAGFLAYAHCWISRVANYWSLELERGAV